MNHEPNPSTPRSESNGAPVSEVPWRLFRRDELPARLRRLQRLEEAAAAEEDERPARPGGTGTARWL